MKDNKKDYSLLHALVDGELTEIERIEVMAWISADERAANEYASVIRLKTALRSVRCAEPDPELWSRCRGRLNEIDRVNRIDSVVGRYSWAMCAAVFAIIIGGGLYARFSGHRFGAQDVASLTSNMIPGLSTSHPSAKTMPGWMKQAVGESPVNNFGRVQVIRAEAGESKGVPVARIFLRDPSGPMVLYVIRGGDPVDDMSPVDTNSQMRGGMIGDLNCVSWTSRGSTCLLAGRRELDALAKVAQSL